MCLFNNNTYNIIFIKLKHNQDVICNPLATGIMSDIFSENKRALVMTILKISIQINSHMKCNNSAANKKSSTAKTVKSSQAINH